MHTRQEKMEAFGRLLDVMDDLREKCPWDRKQTNESLRPNTIEETYELCDALIKEDNINICKELGDVLLHIVFYSKIGEEKGAFDVADVCHKLCDKLIFRHPHVYGDVVANTPDQVRQTWEQIKTKEKDGNKTVLSGVPDALPSLVKAYRIQDKARNVGFDWEERRDVWKKVKEEITEFEAEVEQAYSNAEQAHALGDSPHPDSATIEAAREAAKQHATEEFGDVMFSLINAARLYKINPDNALEHTNQKFIKRFNYVEAKAKEKGQDLKDLTLEQMDAWWNEAKKLG
ncbi:MAG: nucleoside triphosphate pyrophosphohydrolase [Bacteroidaceae bacterium]|nr:nucleoside triphosphate pyrophosphohydrolase [Bacteroidaceae bacterium]